MRFCSIASGSSGNCIYVGTEDTHLLVDAGISGKRIEQGLNELELSTKDMDGILVTHEHVDHVKGLGVLARKYGIPIYATAPTIEEVKYMSSLGEIPEELFHPICADERFSLGDIQVSPMHISHDAADPVAYRLDCGDKSAAVVTDLGIYDDYIVDKIQNLDVLLLEANHDIHMLEVGAYPYPLKQRILGEKGHLSNELSGKLLCQVLGDQTKAVFLGHLSKENNYEELAYATVKLEIDLGDTDYHADDFRIEVASREKLSPVIAF